MEKTILVGFGGFIGSVGRYALSDGVQKLVPASHFPWGTATVNVLGCLLIGWLGALADVRGVVSPETRALVMIGVLGGFTTFSTFAYETLALARNGESMRVVANVFLNLAGCLVAVWLGDGFGRALGGAP
jgi:CrcB protein